MAGSMAIYIRSKLVTDSFIVKSYLLLRGSLLFTGQFYCALHKFYLVYIIYSVKLYYYAVIFQV